jgi:hypothetical protein
VLTISGCQASAIVVIEERVQSSTIDEDVCAVEDAQTPRLWTIDSKTVREGWIIPLGQWLERREGIWIVLHVASNLLVQAEI